MNELENYDQSRNGTLSLIRIEQNRIDINEVAKLVRSSGYLDNISKAEIERATIESGYVSEDFRKLTKSIARNLRAYFGALPENNIELCQVVRQNILDKMPRLTFEDLAKSFSEDLPEKKQGALTANEVLTPIRKVYQKKMNIIFAIQEQERKRIEEEEKHESFKKAAWQILESSCISGEWQGSLFHAMVVAPEVAKLLTQERKNEIWQKDTTPYMNKYNLDNYPVKDPKYFFSQLVIVECIRHHNAPLKILLEARKNEPTEL